MTKKKLYPGLSNNKKSKHTKKIMDFLQYADGKNNLLEISKIIKLNYKNAYKIYNILKQKKLLS
jgi:aminopeptidase-like protein